MGSQQRKKEIECNKGHTQQGRMGLKWTSSLTNIHNPLLTLRAIFRSKEYF